MRRLYRCSRPDLPPDPSLVARALARCPGAFLLRSTGRRNVAILGAWPKEHVFAYSPEFGFDVAACDDPAASSIPRWVGILPYEAFRGLERGCADSDQRDSALFERCEWWRYEAVVLIGSHVEVVGDDAESVERLSRQLDLSSAMESAQLEWIGSSEDDALHAERIRRILEGIANGAYYQVNLARSFHFVANGSALALYQRLFERAAVPFGFALDAGEGRRIVGASPELCLEVTANGSLLTRPIKGTRPRGASAREDLEQISQLTSDPKELAELNMVIDLERNDLGRIAESGSVEVISAGEVESYEAVHHRVATVRAKMRPQTSRHDLLTSFMPSGSVTGTPKRAAMQTIAALETERRGLYTGAMGYLAQDGTLRLAMAIRTLVVNGTGQAAYHSGGGIVADSVAAREITETRWKAQQLLDLFPVRGSQPRPPAGPPVGRNLAENWADWTGSCTEG